MKSWVGWSTLRKRKSALSAQCKTEAREMTSDTEVNNQFRHHRHLLLRWALGAEVIKQREAKKMRVDKRSKQSF